MERDGHYFVFNAILVSEKSKKICYENGVDFHYNHIFHRATTTISAGSSNTKDDHLIVA